MRPPAYQMVTKRPNYLNLCPIKIPKSYAAKLLADITPRIDVMLISVIPGERISIGLNSLGGCAVEYHFVA